jgi:O-antigen/teichoic acid export membrane protein
MLKVMHLNFKKIKNNPFVQQSVKTMLLRVLGIVTLFSFTLFLTHNYDLKIIGRYDFIRTFLLVTGSICILGTDQSILYFTGILKSKGELDKLQIIYKRMIFLIFLTSIIALLLVLLVGNERVSVFFNDNLIFTLILKATIILFFYSVTLFNTEVFRALDSVYIAELFRNTFKYGSVIIGSVVLFEIHLEEYLVDTFLIGFVLLSIISTIMILRFFKKAKNAKIEKEYTYSYITKKSYPMAISTLAIFLLMSFDVMFLKKYKGDETVAFYAIIVKLMTILLMIMNSVTITVSTKIAEYFYVGNIEALSKTMRDSARLIFFLTLPVVVLICMFPEKILTFFGKDFIIAFGAVQVYLNMTGRQHIFQIILIIAVATNFTLNRILIPEYGMNGAAVAYSVSMFLWIFISSIIIYKKDKVNVFLS